MKVRSEVLFYPEIRYGFIDRGEKYMADGKNMDCMNAGRKRTGMLQFYSNKPPVIGNKLIIFIKASKYCYNMMM